MLAVLLALLAVLLAPAALAAGFQVRTMRAPMATTEVERGLIIGRGWLELVLGAEYKEATGYWGDDGSKGTFLDADGRGARWLYTTERVGIRYGVTRHAELHLVVPFHYVQLTNALLGTNTDTFGLGDPTLGWKIEWLRKHAPMTSIATDLYVKVPAGGESPGSFIGGPNTVSSFPLSTGTMDAGIELAGKQQFGPVAITVGLRGTHKFSGVAQYVVEVEEHQFLGRFKPGDEVRLCLRPELQMGPLAASAEIAYAARAAAASGTTSSGIVPDRYLTPIAGSDGWALDLTPALTANITRGFDIVAAVGVPLRGEDLSFFPFEDLTPTRGLTYSATV
ncbi:MAG: hypothetical protein EXR69_08530, partial [Myxococcales bacterium]|nr:hypothetical protein [Myxococcales bacterium]